MSNDKPIEPSRVDTSGADPMAQEIASLLKNAAANNLAGSGVSTEQATKATTLAVLTALGGSQVQEDALEFKGTSFILPKNYEGRIPEAITFLMGHQEQMAAKMDMKRTFEYRPYDVAHAVQEALKKVFGATGKGIAIQTFFGPIQPEMVTVPIGVGQTIQVPWRRVAFAPLSGHIDIGAVASGKNGVVGQVTVNAPRMYRSAVDGFFSVVENELKVNSLYRGKAIVHGESDGEIHFLDLSTVKREDVVYGDEVMAHLEANLWVVLRNMETMRAEGQPIKRAVLLEGPYGTGKSLAGFLTAQQAVANGVTFIFCKPGADLNEAMATAKLYAPAVVFFEDIDVLQSNDPDAVSKLLDTFDGIGGKGREVIAVLTTNNKDKIHKGMLRPGRLDALIHIAALDRGGVERLISAAFRNSDVKLVDVDYDAVFAECDGYLPAFVKEVASRAYRYAMVKVEGKPSELTTEDFVLAAKGLRDHFELMTGAKEIQPPTTLDAALHNAVAGVLEEAKVFDSDGDPSYQVRKIEVGRK